MRKLLKENHELKKQLSIKEDPKNISDLFDLDVRKEPEYDEDQGGRIISKYITREMATAFFTLFWGRQDVYARRGVKGGYFPQCINRWKDICPKQHGIKQICGSCEHKCWTKLTLETVERHLWGQRGDGADVIGVYPLFPNGTCRFLVFDFDNHEKGADKDDYANTDNAWQNEVDALRIICTQNGIEPLVERSRSGRGAHVWIFFSKPVNASIARRFGTLLLDKGASTINLRSFQYYDRLYPSQDISDGIGNLIALPLQGQALQNGNSAFVDENWNAYPDQWDVVYKHLGKRLSPEIVDQYIEKWQAELSIPLAMTVVSQDRPKPWKRNEAFHKEDVTGKFHIVLADGVYIDCLNLAPRLQNQIRAMAAFDNPIYHKNKILGLSNYYNYSSVYLGKDVDGYIRVPRGLREKIIDKCEKAGIKYDIEDEREKGRPIRVSFKGDLRLQQDIAAQALLSYDDGILSAATAFGKTVVCSYLIAQRKVNTLVLVPRKELLTQWVDELTTFLDIDEAPPEYKTKTGRVKVRKDVIGVLSGSKNSLTGIIDVAMIGSVYGKGQLNKLEKSYGMIILDECHHAAAATTVEVLQKIDSRYVYGVSATLKRSDRLEPITYMMLGSVRHSFSAKERAIEQGIDHLVYPRYTRAFRPNGNGSISGAYSFLATNTDRNNMIIRDVIDCLNKGRTPLVLSKIKEQARLLYEGLKGYSENVFLLYGDNTDKENIEIRKKMNSIPDDQSLILIATGQKIGEGFNFPRLDTLMLAAPVSDEGLLTQYVGRLNRDYPGKENVIVYDYIDHHLRVFDNMYNKRLKTYKQIGFQVVSGLSDRKQTVNAIYNSENYMDVFERDLIEANKNIVVSVSEFIMSKVERFLHIVEPRMESGVSVSVIIPDPDTSLDSDYSYVKETVAYLEHRGVEVFFTESGSERFTIIDDKIVWHGSVNFLGKEDYWDNLIRVESFRIASELMELVSEAIKKEASHNNIQE